MRLYAKCCKRPPVLIVETGLSTPSPHQLWTWTPHPSVHAALDWITCAAIGIFARFHLDVGIGDVVIQPFQTIQGQDWLGFAGIPAAAMRLISKEQQIAEKLHAYTLPRSTPNSRVKDLVDLLLLIRTGDVRQAQLAEAVRITFDRRKTHAVPPTLVPPPESWEIQFRELAAECWPMASWK
jgi:hypothetical protein